MEQKLYDKVKQMLKMAKEDNTEYDSKELKYFIDMLYQDYLHDEWGFRTSQIRDEKNKRINQAMFVLLIDKISKETSQLFFSLSDKKLLKKLEYLARLDKVNSFITISAFRPQKNIDNEPEFRPFRRIHRLAYKCNVITADLDFYHKEGGRFEGKTPEEVWKVIQEEKKDLLEKLNIIAVKSGNGLQLYVPCQTFYFNDGRIDKVWKRFNEAFNLEFQEYGADPKCVSDKSRVFRYPGSINWKGDEAIKVKILSDINTVPTIYSNYELRYALADSLYNLKEYSYEETERLIYNVDYEEYDEDLVDKEEIIENHCEYHNAVLELEQSNKIDSLSCNENNINLNSSSQLNNEEKSIHPSKQKSRNIILKSEKPIRVLKENAKLECKINGSKGHKTLISNRLDDLLTYAKRRDWDLYHNRNEFLFLYGVILWQDNLDTDAIYDNLLAINSKMKEPLDNNEVIATVNSISKGNYRKIKNSSIAMKLEFTKEDIALMKSSYTDEDEKRKNAERQKRWYEKHKKKEMNQNDRNSVNKMLIVWNYLNEVYEKNLKLSEKQIDVELQRLTGLKERQVRKYKGEVRKMMSHDKVPDK